MEAPKQSKVPQASLLLQCDHGSGLRFTVRSPTNSQPRLPEQSKKKLKELKRAAEFHNTSNSLIIRQLNSSSCFDTSETGPAIGGVHRGVRKATIA